MKTALAVVAALVIGLVIGSFRIQSELHAARQEIESLQKKLQTRSRQTQGVREITSFLRMSTEPRTAALSSNSALAAASSTATTTASAAAPSATAEPESPPQSFEQQIQTATDLWKTRSQLARNNLLGNLNASPVQAQLFDQTVATMNQQLADKIRAWAEHLKNQPELSPETGLRLMTDLSGPVLGAYDELDRVLEPGWRDKAGPEFALFDHINPEIALPLANVPGVMRRPRHR